jgi:23S rRNA (cytidine1920-2'-O)/16S rRNA (cytidine1409-2'-O)-methyltransferase
VATREQAHIAIADGLVLVSGSLADKASRLVSPSEAIILTGAARRFVSRGGEKLEGALDAFALDVRGRRALDAGASTGGFVDCLLQRGATRVYALDVGHGQLDAGLRADPRVCVFERINVRTLAPANLDLAGEPFEPVDVVTADLSFISLVLVARPLVEVLRPDGDLVALVKPQFEAGRAEVGRGRGVIRDPAVWRRVLGDVTGALLAAGTGIMGAMPSPLRGSSGNVEFLLHARWGPVEGPNIDALLDAAVGAVGGDAE